jgi:hypothetical protein
MKSMTILATSAIPIGACVNAFSKRPCWSSPWCWKRAPRSGWPCWRSRPGSERSEGDPVLLVRLLHPSGFQVLTVENVVTEGRNPGERTSGFVWRAA